eukprot:RCo028285
MCVGGGPSTVFPKMRIVALLRGVRLRPPRVAVDASDPWGVRPNTFTLEVSMEVHPGQHWLILGSNGSGKSTLGRALCGTIRHLEGSLQLALPREKMAYVSFAEQVQVVQAMEKAENLRRDFGKNARDDESLIPTAEQFIGLETCTVFQVDPSSRLNLLSSGELRKAVLGRVLQTSPEFVVLDEPFDGLDQDSRNSVMRLLERLVLEKHSQFVIITHRFEEIPSFITNVLVLKGGKVVFQGSREAALAERKSSGGLEAWIGRYFETTERAGSPRFPIFPDSLTARDPSFDFDAQEVIELRNLGLRFGTHVVLQDFSWKVLKGQHWQIKGRNGAGKSSLVKIISASVPMTIQKGEMYLLGKQVGYGSGVGIWSVRQIFGLVSTELHSSFAQQRAGSMTVFDVIGSGFHESIGLFEPLTELQANAVQKWAEVLDLAEMLERPFLNTSQGQQRLALIARALVKQPRILVLDEPLHGLDPSNRSKILDFLSQLAKERAQRLTILYISHASELSESKPDFITHTLCLGE